MSTAHPSRTLAALLSVLIVVPALAAPPPPRATGRPPVRDLAVSRDRDGAPIVDRALAAYLARDDGPRRYNEPVEEPLAPVPQPRRNYYPGLRSGQHANANMVRHQCVPGRAGMLAGR